MRLAEALLLQVEQGLLEADDADPLGFGGSVGLFLTTPGQVCFWRWLSEDVSPSIRDRVGALPDGERAICPMDLEAVMEQEQVRLAEQAETLGG